MKTNGRASMCIICAFLALLSVGGAPASLDGQTQGIGIVPCDVRAYVLNGKTDITVRKGPGLVYQAVGTLPIQKVEGIEVHITGASGQWVSIDRAMEEGGDPDKILFQGKGWIYAHVLGASGKSISHGGTDLYQAKSKRSPVISWVSVDDSVTLQGCHGQWIFVEHKKKKGWAAPDTLCPNSLTTCV